MWGSKAKTYKFTVDGRDNHNRRPGLKWWIFGQFVLFSLVMLVLLWLVQTVFLDTIYQKEKTNNIKQTAAQIADTLRSEGFESEALQTVLSNIAHDSYLCVRVADLSKPEGHFYIWQTSEVTPGCVVHNLTGEEILILAAKAAEQGGNIFYNLGLEDDKMMSDGLEQVLGAQYSRLSRLYQQQRALPALLFSVSVAEGADGGRYAIILNGAISPLDSTVSTLRLVLIAISGVMVLLGLALAIFTAERISRPIVHINKLSHRLAQGDFAMDFRVPRAYREIDELSGTLNYAATELDKTEQLQKDLIANISHDLRTPLTLITGYAEAMRDLPGENTPENVQVIIDETQRLSTLVNDLLDMSKVQAGAVQLDYVELELTELIRTIINRFNKLTATEGYTINFQPAARLWVMADEVRLTQVIYNLLNNAITYTGEDKQVTIRQLLLHKDKRVRIEVIDTGEGIAPEQVEKIWQRYYHGSANHRRTQAGNGLGLAIVKAVLDMHGSAYGVESTPGKGSRFWFELDVLRTEKIQ